MNSYRIVWLDFDYTNEAEVERHVEHVKTIEELLNEGYVFFRETTLDSIVIWVLAKYEKDINQGI